MFLLKSRLYQPIYFFTNFSKVNQDEKRLALKRWVNNSMEDACRYNFKDVIKFCYNQKNINFELCLKLACDNNHLDIVKFLLKKCSCSPLKICNYRYSINDPEIMKLMKVYIIDTRVMEGGLIESNRPEIVDMIRHRYYRCHLTACIDQNYSLMNYYESVLSEYYISWVRCLGWYAEFPDLTMLKYILKKGKIDREFAEQIIEQCDLEEPVLSYLKEYVGK